MNTEKMRAVMLAADEGKPIEFRKRNRVCDWLNTSKPTWDWVTCDYRVKPEPERVPRTMADLPEGGALWIREWLCPTKLAAVVFCDSGGVVVSRGFEHISNVFLYNLPHPEIEISSDRKTWLPWWKEVEA